MMKVKAGKTKAPARPLEVNLAKMTHSSPGMIRFWAARLVIEIAASRRLTPEEAGLLGSRVYASFPRVGTRNILWPEGAND